MLLEAIGWLIFDAVVLAFGIACVFFVLWWIVNCIRGLRLVIGFQEKGASETGPSVPPDNRQPPAEQAPYRWDQDGT